MVPGLLAKTWQMINPKTYIHPAVDEILRKIMLDPQTSGGLLAAVHPQDQEPLISKLIADGVEAALVGWVEEESEKRILVD